MIKISGFILLIVSIFSFLCFSSSTIIAQNFVVTEISGQPFTRGQIVADFLDVAFTDKIWTEDRQDFEKNLNTIPSPDYAIGQLRRDHTWLSDYLSKNKTWPKSGVINKWRNEITVGIGMPVAIGKPGGLNYGTSPQTDEILNLIEEQVNALLPELEQATGRSVTFIKPGDPRDKTKDFARLLIIPTSVESYFGSFTGGPFVYENLVFWSGVPFESNKLEINDGVMKSYILPDDDNSISLGICKINPTRTDPALLKALVTECLVRTMGLPGFSQREVTSSLIDWYSDYRDRSNADNKDEDTQPLQHTLSQYDRFMISLLYCPEIKAGMTKNEVVQLISQKKLCLSQH